MPQRYEHSQGINTFISDSNNYLMSVSQCHSTIVEELNARSNPTRAGQMEAYLRHKFPFFGIMSQERSALLKQFRSNGLDELSSLDKRKLVKILWEEPHRECQLLALAWMMKWKEKELMASDLLFFEELITAKSWWDTVDGIAPNLIGKYALKYPEHVQATWKEWESHESFWIRRSCLIFQLRYKQQTDLDLLQHFIGKFKHEKEFFIQKAIGWSLREVSKWNPTWTAEIVRSENLIGLARREALKYVP